MSHNKIGYTGTSASTAVAAPAAPYGVYSIFRCLANLKPNSNAKLKSNPKPNLNLNLRFPRFGETAKMKHSALAVVRRSQKISPRRRPLPGGAGRPKFNQLEMVTTFTYRPSLVRIDARNFELSW